MKDLVVDIVPDKPLQLQLDGIIEQLAALRIQLNWIWSAIDEIWETMPQEPEPERDER